MGIDLSSWKPSYAIEGNSLLLLNVPFNGTELDIRAQLPKSGDFPSDYQLQESVIRRVTACALSALAASGSPTQTQVHYYEQIDAALVVSGDSSVGAKEQIRDNSKAVYECIKTGQFALGVQALYGVSNDPISPIYSMGSSIKKELTNQIANPPAKISENSVQKPNPRFLELMDTIPYKGIQYTTLMNSDSTNQTRILFNKLLVTPKNKDEDAIEMKQWLKNLANAALDKYFTQDATQPPNDLDSRKKLAVKAVLAGLATADSKIDDLSEFIIKMVK